MSTGGFVQMVRGIGQSSALFCVSKSIHGSLSAYLISHLSVSGFAAALAVALGGIRCIAVA